MQRRRAIIAAAGVHMVVAELFIARKMVSASCKWGVGALR